MFISRLEIIIGVKVSSMQDVYRIGITGTQKGIKEHRLNLIKNFILDKTYEYNDIEIHHGACIGVDTQVHVFCRGFDGKVDIIVHPPIDKSKQGVLPKLRGREHNVYWRVPYDYLVRNKHIVNECDILVAAPSTQYEVLRSGTWATIRYARKMGKGAIVV